MNLHNADFKMKETMKVSDFHRTLGSESEEWRYSLPLICKSLRK